MAADKGTILLIGILGIGAYALFKSGSIFNNPAIDARQASKVAVTEAATPYKIQEAILEEQVDIQQDTRKLKRATSQTIITGYKQEAKIAVQENKSTYKIDKSDYKYEAKELALEANQPANITRQVEYGSAFKKVFMPTAKVGYERRQKLKTSIKKIGNIFKPRMR